MTEYISVWPISLFLPDQKREWIKKIEQFRRDGYTILGEPRTTGDGFYEGSVADPDGNIIEIVA